MNPTMTTLSSLLKDSRSSAFPVEYDIPMYEWPGEMNTEPWRDLPSIHFAVPQYDLYDRPRHVNEIMAACLNYGIFEVVSHELPEDVNRVMNKVLRSSARFFVQPYSNLTPFANQAGTLYSGSIAKAVGLERESYWRDTLTMTYNTGSPAFSWPTQRYLRTDVPQFASALIGFISKGLELGESYFPDHRLSEDSNNPANFRF